ncbi:MAG: type 4a pilus biogenesis protein PilO [Comamonadaceae bacterium]
MNLFNSNMTRGTAKLGWQGLLGAALLVLVAVLYFASLRPEQSELQSLQRQIESARHSVASPAGDAAPAHTPAQQLDAFYASFPNTAELPALLEKVFACARQQGLQLELGEYRVSRDSADGLTQFQLTLPVRGSYLQIRRFMASAMTGVTTMSLDSIQFDRQKVSDSTLTAKVKLTIYLGASS